MCLCSVSLCKAVGSDSGCFPLFCEGIPCCVVVFSESVSLRPYTMFAKVYNACVICYLYIICVLIFPEYDLEHRNNMSNDKNKYWVLQ